MQANCLVFPSPQRYNIQPILYKIVLIPQNSIQNQHIAYHHYLNLSALNQEDDLQKTIKRLNNQHMLKTRDQTKFQPKSQNKNYQMIHKYTQNTQDKSNFRKYSTNQSEKQNLKNQYKQFFNDHDNRLKQNNKFNETSTSVILNYQVSSEEYIPCLFLPGKKDKIIVFFHANAEDITSSYQFLKMINLQSQYSLLAMQYRGYSINDGQVNPALINKDANRVLEYLFQRSVLPEQIIVFGRSIGCAIALGVMRQQLKVYALILLSPFLSLKKIAKQLYGNCAGWALKQGFDNQKNTLNINCPLLLIHGMKDNLVPYQHSLALFSQCKAFCQLKLIQTMSHSRFNFRSDFIKHFQTFVRDLEQNNNQ